MSIVDRADDSPRTIFDGKVCWRCLMAGTIFAGGLALPSSGLASCVVAVDGTLVPTVGTPLGCVNSGTGTAGTNAGAAGTNAGTPGTGIAGTNAGTAGTGRGVFGVDRKECCTDGELRLKRTGVRSRRGLRNLIQGTAVAATPYAGGPKPAAWISGYGDYERRDGQASFSFAGTNFSSNLGYRQGTAGVTGGIDTVWRGLATTTDGLVVGLLGGYTISRVELRDSPTTQEFSGPSAGIYATYLTGNWFFDSLFKVDLLSLDINTPGMSQSANLINYNLATNIGYRFDIPYHYYIEPTAGLEYVRTNFDHATALTARV
jgi:hypothetical protein